MSRTTFILAVLLVLIGAVFVLLSLMDTSVEPTRIEMSVGANAAGR